MPDHLSREPENLISGISSASINSLVTPLPNQPKFTKAKAAIPYLIGKREMNESNIYSTDGSQD